MFVGEYQHTLDSKGRLILPSAFREPLEKGLVITVSQDRCLKVHPRAEWQRVLEGLRELRSTDEQQRKFLRVMTSQAHLDELDKQGRITIPGRLREYALLQRDVAVVGADSAIELWDAERWASYRDESMSEFAAIDTPLGEGVF
ncbi:MAG: cell division/cell wall cluster transcriptional repressor MraZ [Actinobacteria bacterium QS_8_72_14]|nr:MAG: cell division/cell wall cluster transcriptional repressor MraZ [Actinobacteria bacterium QS_8_72_14]